MKIKIKIYKTMKIYINKTFISSFRNVTLEAVCLCDAFYLLELLLQSLGCICIVERKNSYSLWIKVSANDGM